MTRRLRPCVIRLYDQNSTQRIIKRVLGFDVEGAYIFSWAIAWENLGWKGWLQIGFFIGELILGLVYIWEKGGLEWGPTGKLS